MDSASKSWTNVPEDEVLAHYATLTLRQLRRQQDLVNQQISMAHEQRNTEAMVSLHYAKRLLTEAVSRHAWMHA